MIKTKPKKAKVIKPKRDDRLALEAYEMSLKAMTIPTDAAEQLDQKYQTEFGLTLVRMVRELAVQYRTVPNAKSESEELCNALNTLTNTVAVLTGFRMATHHTEPCDGCVMQYLEHVYEAIMDSTLFALSEMNKSTGTKSNHN